MAAMYAALQSVVKYFNPAKTIKCAADTKLSAIQYKAVFGILVAFAILSGLTSWYSRIECAAPDSAQVDKKLVECSSLEIQFNIHSTRAGGL